MFMSIIHVIPYDTRLGKIIICCSVDVQHLSNIGVPGLVSR